MQGETPDGAPKPAKRQRKKPATSLQADFEATEEMYQWASERYGFDRQKVALETEKFMRHHTAKGSTFSDWQQAWATWMMRAVEYG